jgi:phage terminase large subunit-like protein
VTPENVIRFGRIGKATGNVIDHDTTVKPSADWNCGNITGAGMFPTELYCPEGKQIWIGTIAKSVDTLWWPAFAGSGAARFFPEEFIDKAKGNRGFNGGLKIVHAINDIDIHIKTYEQGHTKFESQTCWMLAYDEEPPAKEIYLSGALHATYQRFSFTPLNGKTWSEETIFSCVRPFRNGDKTGLKRSDFDYYYASQFDSPYIDREKLMRDRRAMALWERKARVWGQYSEFQGMPFFNRSRIQVWRDTFRRPYRNSRYIARSPYHGISGSAAMGLPGILSVTVDEVPASEDDTRDVWRVYEGLREGVGYIMTGDAAEGAVDLTQVQDKSFASIYRLPVAEEAFMEKRPVLVAACRSTLPTVAFAESCLPVLHYYNNATLAAERGHGKDNEAFGITLEQWPYWYMRSATNDRTKALRTLKGFDTNSHTRTIMFDMIRAWLDAFEEDEDPQVRDDRLYEELGAAILRELPSGKKRCDHTGTSSLDGAICMGIATYIAQESPDVYVCRVQGGDKRENSLMSRLRRQAETSGRASGGDGYPRPMGSGVAGMGTGRRYGI